MCISGATTDNLPPGVMYRVKASYKYQAEDVDELNFEVGEIIDVVEYDDSEDQVWLFESTFKCIFPLNFDFFLLLQEEGWLMGVMQSTGQKGMFPANFTRPM